MAGRAKLTPQYDASTWRTMRQVAVWCREEYSRVDPDCCCACTCWTRFCGGWPRA